MLDTKFVWIETKSVNKNNEKTCYYYNLSSRKTVWSKPDDSDGKTVIVDQAEYKKLIQQGELPRPVNVRRKVGKTVFYLLQFIYYSTLIM